MSCVKREGAETAATGPGGLDFNRFEAMAPRMPVKTPAPFRNGKPVKENAVAPAGVYQPNYNILTPEMRSPDYVQMSTAAAITLGLMKGRM